MEKNAYLLVTDLHISIAKRSRNNYFSEIVSAMAQILSIADNYKSKGYTMNLILLGDVVDSATNSVSDALVIYDTLKFFVSRFDYAYSLVGNHEITYCKNNPFWYLVSEIEDDVLKSILPRLASPKSVEGCVRVVDSIVDGNVRLLFNHFGVPIKRPVDATFYDIGLFHQNIGSNEITQMYGDFVDVDNTTQLSTYKRCFFGHVHLAFGKYILDESTEIIGEWLGSIGRTKVNEVDENLERNIPVITVCDGQLESIDDNMITLQDYETSIDVSSVQRYEKVKTLQETRKKNTVVNVKGRTLLESIKLSAPTPLMKYLLQVLSGTQDSVLNCYQQDLHEIEGD